MKRLGILALAGGLLWTAAVRAAEEEVPAELVKAVAKLEDTDPEIRYLAVSEIERYNGSLPNSVAVALALRVRDRDSLVRHIAARSLRTHKNRPDSAVPALIAGLSDPHDDVRQHSAYSLKEYGVKAKAAIPVLVRMLGDSNSHIRSGAAAGLAGAAAPTASRETVQALIAALEDTEHGVRNNASDALGAVAHGANAEIAVAALRRLSSDPAHQVRLAAATAIAKLTVGPEPTGNDPHSVLDGTDPQVKFELLRGYVTAKPGEARPAAELVAKLIPLLRDKDVRVAGQAAMVLGLAGAEAKAAVPTLVEMLDARDAHLQSFVIHALTNIGPEPSAVPKLTRLLSVADDTIIELAADALCAIGLKAGPAAPQLVKALECPRYQARESAAKALGAIGVRSKDVFDALRTAEKDPAERVRKAAAEAMEKLTGVEKKG